MFTAIVAAITGAVCFLAGMWVMACAVNDAHVEETEDTFHTPMTEPPRVTYAGQWPLVAPRRE